MGTLTIIGICLSIGGGVLTTVGTSVMCVELSKKLTAKSLMDWKAEVKKKTDELEKEQ